MSYFGNALQALLTRKNMRGVRLAELSGVSQPAISRYIRGDQSFVAHEDLEAITGAISNNPADRAELIRAHLLDECHGPGSELIDIAISGVPTKEAASRHNVKLPEHLEHALAAIREHLEKDKNLREIIEGLGNLLTRGDCRTNEERGDVNYESEDLEAGIVSNLEKDLKVGKSSASKKRRAPGK
jgi:transcriptional regulator with XRE-family HTH domain